jgi:hypothetical protein
MIGVCQQVTRIGLRLMSPIDNVAFPKSPGKELAMRGNLTSKKSNSRVRTLAAIDAVEVKVTIRPDQELRAGREMELNEDTAEVRVIYFYDTSTLDLFDAGIALRARLVKGDDDDSTVKFRPVDAAKISDEWKELKGFKLEADCVGKQVVCSASLTVIQKRNEIDDVTKGRRPIVKLFSNEQERFLREFYGRPVDFERLCVMGPIRVLRWKLEHKDFPHELTVEEWRLPNGDDLVEASIKTSPDEALQARKDFEKHLKSIGLDPKGAQQTKTRTALRYFAEEHQKARR